MGESSDVFDDDRDVLKKKEKKSEEVKLTPVRPNMEPLTSLQRNPGLEDFGSSPFFATPQPPAVFNVGSHRECYRTLVSLITTDSVVEGS